MIKVLTSSVLALVIDPKSLNVMSNMPPQPTFDDKTFNALEAYFKAMMPIE
jgi:hypothetical protein